MSRELVIEAVALYLPLSMCMVLYSLQKEGNGDLRRSLVAGLMASSWVAATLPWVNDLCVWVGFWSFSVGHGYGFENLPLSMYVGWVLLWGVLPAMLMYYFRVRWIMVGMILLDILTMGMFSPVMVLHGWSWLYGEFLLVVICFVPAVYMAKWVRNSERVGWRSGLISSAFAMLILVVLPTSVAEIRVDLWGIWSGYTLVEKCLWLILLTIVCMPGIAGVIEFSVFGKGTPIPYDAPEYLVTSGVYSYVQNPMQLSMVLVLLVWSWMFNSWFVFLLGVVAVVYCVGIARWSEGVDLKGRFGEDWVRYDARIKAWKCSLAPVRGGFEGGENARVFIDDRCVVCQSIALWIGGRGAVGLDVIAAKGWEGEALKRLTYVDVRSGERFEGVLAMARVFQHIHVGWAWLGWVAMIPGITHFIQLVVDSAGGGARDRC